jgi:uncharacterized protein (TIGR02118 family)
MLVPAPDDEVRRPDMIIVDVLYPYDAGASFDMDYYLGSHIPMVRDRLGDALKGCTIGQGLAGLGPGEPPSYAATCRLAFESVETFQAAFGPNVEAFLADAPNYTAVQPTVQLSEMKL